MITSSKFERVKKEIASFDPPSINLNYFSQQEIKKHEYIPYLLKRLTKEANTLGIRFISIDPQPSENTKYYQKHNFLVQLKAIKYIQLFNFLHCLEDTLQLNIQELHIHTEDSPKRPPQLKAKLSLNTIEMKNHQFKNFSTLAELKNYYATSGSSQNGFKAPLEQSYHKPLLAGVAKSNPFGHDLFTAPLYQKEQFVIKKANEELVLTAILFFQDEPVAIIGHDQVKKGEYIKNAQIGEQCINLKVLNITQNSIVLGDGKKTYIYKLPDNPITFK